jgi:hypothetical protein
MPEQEPTPTPKPPDYYFENGLLVYTAAYHLKRGYCCGSGCRHCPYEPKHPRGVSKQMASENEHTSQDTRQTHAAAGESADRLHALLQAFTPSRPLVGTVTAGTLAEIDRRLAMLQDQFKEAWEAASGQNTEGPPDRAARS